ncbi:unnamed protein product [Effrenium voratum]|uniref:Uncharacterized protein n=1 Tax=Effrenium voratum TaxID=2562239 RepID=A0AA36NMF5_9DINO|nr:unnamed protein product [Effrenium voratum]
MEALDPLETDCFPGGCSWLWKARRHTRGESHAQETDAGPEPQKTTLECDEDGVPWFRRTNTCFEKDGEPFVSHFFTDKDLEGQVYKRGKSHFEDAIGVYPPRTFDRRLTTNIWQSTLAASMLEAGLRLTALMAREIWSRRER